MANPEHAAKLREGVEAWDAWRGGMGEGMIPNLAGAGLTQDRLSGINRAPIIAAIA
jgi:hypothetical protein